MAKKYTSKFTGAEIDAGLDKIPFIQKELTELGKRFDDLLFPTVYPTFVEPSATISFNGYSYLQEVGAQGPTAEQLSAVFNAGAILLGEDKVSDRAGELIEDKSFIYVRNNPSNRTLPQPVTLSATSYRYKAAYAEGPQPKDSKGNDYGSSLPMGAVDSPEILVKGTYPWYASTSGEDVVKQPLIAWNGQAGGMDTGNFTLQPSGTTAQVFKLPRQLASLQQLNTISGRMEPVDMSDYTETTETIDINGNVRTYYVYTYNGAARGAVTLSAKF